MVGKRQKSIAITKRRKVLPGHRPVTHYIPPMRLTGREVTKINLTTKRRKVLYGQVPAHDALCASFGHILSVLKQKVCKEFNFFLASPKRNKKRRQRLYISTKLSTQYPLALRQSSKIQHCSCEFSAELGLRWCKTECIRPPPKKQKLNTIANSRFRGLTVPLLCVR